MQLKGVLRGGARRLRVGTVLSATLTARLYGGTDKVSHGYLPYYDRHLGGRRHRRLIVIEIGVGGDESDQPSGSLQLWRDYFPRSTIIGVDVHPKTLTLGSRVRFVRADQSSPDDLRRVLAAAASPPDVVIDDGSHIGEHVCTTFEAVFPSMAAGGVYVIEDLHASYWPSYGGAADPPARTAVGLLRDLMGDAQADDRSFARRPDLGTGPTPRYADVASVAVYPGIAFVEHA